MFPCFFPLLLCTMKTSFTRLLHDLLLLTFLVISYFRYRRVFEILRSYFFVRLCSFTATEMGLGNCKMLTCLFHLLHESKIYFNWGRFCHYGINKETYLNTFLHLPYNGLSSLITEWKSNDILSSCVDEVVHST